MRGLCTKPFFSHGNKFLHRIAHDTSTINPTQNVTLNLLRIMIVLRGGGAITTRLGEVGMHAYYSAIFDPEWLATIRTDRSLKVRETPAVDELILLSIAVTNLPITEDMATRQTGWSTSALRRSTTVCFEANITV